MPDEFFVTRRYTCQRCLGQGTILDHKEREFPCPDCFGELELTEEYPLVDALKALGLQVPDGVKGGS